MGIVGLLIVFLLGLIVVHTLAGNVSSLLKVGVALPVGFGINAFVMFGLDIIHVPLYYVSIVPGMDAIIILMLAVYLFYRTSPLVYLLEWRLRLGQVIDGLLSRFHPAWVLLFGAVVWLVCAVVAQAFFWPVFIYDSITGFDFVAKTVLSEGTLNNSIFDPQYPLYTLRSVYPPLVALNFAFMYGIGFSSSHGVVALFYASMAVSFYGVLRLYTTHFSAALFTLLLIITPEYASFSILSSSNPVCAYYVSIGLLCLYVAYERDAAAYSTIGMLLILFALWTRPEAVVFAAFAGVFALWTGIRKRAFVKPVVFGVVCLAVFASWQMYVRLVLPVQLPETTVPVAVFDTDKLLRMLEKVVDVTFNTRYYGVVVFLFFAVMVMNIRNMIVYKDRLALLLLLCGGWAIYILIFYAIDTDFKPGSTNWIEDAYRRGLFCFFPLMVFYVAVSRLSTKLFNQYLNF